MEGSRTLEEEDKTLKSVQYNDQTDNAIDEAKEVSLNLPIAKQSLSQGDYIDEEKEEYVASATNRGEEDILEGATIGENDVTDHQALSSDDEEVS